MSKNQGTNIERPQKKLVISIVIYILYLFATPLPPEPIPPPLPRNVIPPRKTLKCISWWVYVHSFTVYQKKNFNWVNNVNVSILTIKQNNIKLSCVSSIFLINLIKRSWCSHCIYGMVVMNNLGFPIHESYLKMQVYQI